MEKGGESIQPNLEKEKTPKKLKIFEIKNFDKFEDICSIENSEEIESSQYLLLENNENTVAISYGAGPCVSGILQTNDNKIYMFHDYAKSSTTPKQEKIIKNIKKGIIGSGSTSSLDAFKSKLLNNKNVKSISPPGENYIFNIAFVKKENNSKVSPGFYFCFDQSEVNWS